MNKERNEPTFREDLTAYQQVKEVISEYAFRPLTIKNQGKTWVAQTDQGVFRVERFNHSVPEFFFVLSSIEYLERQGCRAFPKLLLNKEERPLTEKSYGIFFVTEFPDGQIMDAREIDGLTRMIDRLAEIHRLSVGFSPPENLTSIRQDWGDWEEKWQYRLDELYRLGEEAQHRKGDFDKEYLKGMDDALRDGVNALETLKRLNFREIVEAERLRGGLCHRDFRPINLLEKEQNYWLLDFDDFAGQSHLEDIARFIKEVGGWDGDRITYILEQYSFSYAIAREEREAIFAYLKLPTDLWRVARNYYVKGKPQKRNLKGVLNEMKDKKRCFHQLDHPKGATISVQELPWMWSIPPEPAPMGNIDDYWNTWNKQIFHQPVETIIPSPPQETPSEPILNPETERLIEGWLADLESYPVFEPLADDELVESAPNLTGLADRLEVYDKEILEQEDNLEVIVLENAESSLEEQKVDKVIIQPEPQIIVEKKPTVIVWKSFPRN